METIVHVWAMGARAPAIGFGSSSGKSGGANSNEDGGTAGANEDGGGDGGPKGKCFAVMGTGSQ